MKWFYNLNIATKLIAAFLSIIVLIAALGIFSIVQLDKVNAASADIVSNWLPGIRVLGKIKFYMARMRSFELQHILTATPQEGDEVLGRLNRDIAVLAEQRKQYEAIATDAQRRAIYADISKAINGFMAVHATIIELSREDKKAEATALLQGASTEFYRKMIAGVDKLVDVTNAGADASSSHAGDIYSASRMLIVGILALAIVAALVLALAMARVIAGPLSDAVQVARRVADGDLSADIRQDRKDETGQLIGALKLMNDNLLKIVSRVRAGTDAISTASAQIATGNLDLSSRTEHQAGSLQQTASAMEELTSTVKQNADNARQARELALSASDVAIKGGDVVGQVIDKMEAINAASRKVVDIISVIDGIAFQTNILALNAAVEAARAGEQGRGFAVVASEVRSLAQRSSAAAKEIKDLIDDSVAKVDIGSRLVVQAGATMEEIVDSVRRVTDIVGEISSASHEQSTGIDEINRAITQMDEVTQQNATLVEQAAAAAQSLQDQADALAQTVAVFKLNRNPDEMPSLS